MPAKKEVKRSIDSRVKQIDPSVKARISKQTLEKRKKRVPRRFVIVLSIVSILGFAGIASRTLFDLDISSYVEVAWIWALGIGILLEADLKSLKNIRRTGLNSGKFNNLVAAVIGFLALITGLLSLPQINWLTSGLEAIKGVISLVAIIFIMVESLILKD